MPETNPLFYTKVLLSNGIKTKHQKEQTTSSSSINGVGKTGFQTQKIET